jgi:hypothetical protein
MRLMYPRRALALPVKILAVRRRVANLTQAARPGVAKIRSCSARSLASSSAFMAEMIRASPTGCRRSQRPGGAWVALLGPLAGGAEDRGQSTRPAQPASSTARRTLQVGQPPHLSRPGVEAPHRQVGIGNHLPHPARQLPQMDRDDGCDTEIGWPSSRRPPAGADSRYWSAAGAFLTLFQGLVVVLVLAVVVVDDLQDLDEAEGGRSRRRAASWSGSTSAMGSAGYRRGGSSRRAPRCR